MAITTIKPMRIQVNMLKWNWSFKDKLILTVTGIIFILLLFLLFNDQLLVLNSSKSNKPVIGKIIDLENDVRYKISGQFNWMTANIETPIHENDSIFTNKTSKVTVALDSGVDLELSESSLVVFNFELQQKILNLKFGEMYANLNKNADLAFSIDGEPAKISGSEKSKIKITKLNANEFKLDVVSGEVSISKKGSQKKVKQTEPLQITKSSMNTMPSATPKETPRIAPMILTPKDGEIITFPVDEDGEPTKDSVIPIEWKANRPTKNDYEVQISQDPQFTDTFEKILSKEQKIQSPKLVDGIHYLRVRERSEKFDQPWSLPISVQIQKEETPNLDAPILKEENIIYKVPQPYPLQITWTPVKNAFEYSIEISKSKAFEIKQYFNTKKTTITLNEYTTGDFYFRVFAKTKKGNTSDSSRIGSLTITTLIPELKDVPPIVDFGKSPDDQGLDRPIGMEWTSTPLAASYELDISQDENFKDSISQKVNETKSKVLLPKPGVFFARVRPLGKMGQVLTDYSSSKKIYYTLKKPLHQPILQDPFDKTTVFFQKKGTQTFWFEWKPVPEATQYRIEISQEPDFNKILVKQTVKSHRYLLRKQLKDGSYYWRVIAENEVNHSHWSQVFQVNILAGRTAQ